MRGRSGTVPTSARRAPARARRRARPHGSISAGEPDQALVAKAARTLRLGAFPSAIVSIVPSALAAVRTAAPELEITVEEDTQDELAAGVQWGDLHLSAVLPGRDRPRREHDGLRRIDLAEEPMLALVAADGTRSPPSRRSTCASSPTSRGPPRRARGSSRTRAARRASSRGS